MKYCFGRISQYKNASNPHKNAVLDMNNATNVAKEEIALLREYGSREKNKTVFTNRPYAKITSCLRAYSMCVGVLYNPAFYRLWIFTRGNLPRGRNHRKDGGDCDFTLAQRHYALIYVAG